MVAMSINPDEDRHVLRIELPAPLSVIGAVTNLIGMAWPDSGMRNGFRGVEFLIPKEDPIEVTQEQAAAAVAEEARDRTGIDAQITALGPDSEGRLAMDVAMPRDTAWAGLGEFAAAALSLADEEHDDPERFPNGVNYIEADMNYGGQPFKVIACRDGRDPAAMHRKAQAQLDRYIERYGSLDGGN